jgi:hypothetical protein
LLLDAHEIAAVVEEMYEVLRVRLLLVVREITHDAGRDVEYERADGALEMLRRRGGKR